jgi:uncharacterized protein
VERVRASWLSACPDVGEDTLGYAAANISVRFALWVLPVFLCLGLVDRVDLARSLALVDGWKRGVLLGIGLSIIILVGSFVRFGAPEPSWNNVTWSTVLSTSLGIGFFEEIPFRGFILQKLATRMNFWLANILTSIIFVSGLLPGWVMLHLFTPALAVNIFVFSIVMGAAFRYSRSLWSCIIAHDASDFISFVLFHSR